MEIAGHPKQVWGLVRRILSNNLVGFTFSFRALVSFSMNIKKKIGLQYNSWDANLTYIVINFVFFVKFLSFIYLFITFYKSILFIISDCMFHL